MPDWTILLLASFIGFGNYYAFDLPASLHQPLQSYLNLKDYEYYFSLFYSLYSIPNMFLPFFSGYISNKIGSSNFLILLSSLITTGQFFFAIGTQMKNIYIMLFGRLIFGLGGETLYVLQSEITCKYYKDYMTMALGINICIGRTGSVLNDFLSPLLADYSMTLAVYVGLCTCLLSSYCAFKLSAMARNIQTHSIQGFDLRFPIQYWIVNLVVVTMYATVIPFNAIHAALLEYKFYTGDPIKSAQIMSVPDILAVVFVPFTGMFVDKYGYRLQMLIACCVMLLITHSFFLSQSKSSPRSPIPFLMIMGTAYSLLTVLWSVVPLIIPAERLTHAFGVMTAIFNMSLTIFPIIVASLITNDETFTTTEIFFIVSLLCSLAGLVSLLYYELKNEDYTKKPFGLKNLFQKKQQPVDIRTTAYYDAKLIKPFRFTPQIDPGNSGIQAFITLVEDEKIYAAEMRATIDRLAALEPTNTILQEIDSSPDTAIISKLPGILEVYTLYVIIYMKFEQEWNATVENDKKIGFEMNNIMLELARPFQRLLEYRFFLKSILKYHHGCDPAKCNINTCTIKLKCNVANRKATVLLNGLIARVSQLFRVKDNFEELSKWENLLQSNMCRAIGEQKDKPELYKLELYLTAPFKSPTEKICQLPEILASEEFQVLPISEHIKLFTKKNDNFVLNNVHVEDLVLHLLSDTLVITGKIDTKTNQMLLLYPPMPVTHISIEKHACVDNVYSLKISPFCILLIKCVDLSRGKQFADLLLQQKETLSSIDGKQLLTFEPEYLKVARNEKGSKPVEIERKVYKISENDKFQLEFSTYDKPNEKIIELQCIPYIFRAEGDGGKWAKIAKCDLVLERVDGKYVLLLSMCETKKSVLATTINASTRVKRDANPKRFYLSIFNDGDASQYLVQVGTKEKADSLVGQLEAIVFECITETHSNLNSELVLNSYPEWADLDENNFKHIALGRHSSCLLRIDDSAWTHIGRVSSYLLVNAVGEQLYSAQLVIRSELNPQLTFLRLELKPELWSIRAESNNQVYLRVFTGIGKTDFNLSVDNHQSNAIIDVINEQSKIRETKLQLIENEMKSCSSRATEIGGLINSYLQSVDLEKEETMVNFGEETLASKPDKNIPSFESIKERFETKSKDSIPDSIENIISSYDEPSPKLYPSTTPASKSAPDLFRKYKEGKSSSDSLVTASQDPENPPCS
ncbi:hypothetical protein HDV01_006439 [Terramyces sp. JEL0728]|nr:hypothetical protein HDV01_006439 [Terramyces sp. JEL0728]